MFDGFIVRAVPGALTVALLVTLLVSGCASDRGGDAPAAYLEPSGWQNPTLALQAKNFTDYATLIRKDIQQHRWPHTASTAAQEITMASPTEQVPIAECNDVRRGIAILVHGLSDTAFAMRDIGHVLAQNCYLVRSVLLPGHGTRAGDLLTTRAQHWHDTVSYLVDQAALEHDHIIVGGFSLGAVLTMESALQPDSPVDAILAFSPAYYLSSYRLARLTPFVHPFKRWIDRGVADDSMRYEAMPTRGVAETVKSMQSMHAALNSQKHVRQPWLLVQSLDDAVTLPERNLDLFERYADHAGSLAVGFYTGDKPITADSRQRWIPGHNESLRVRALTHLAVHISPENEHYGINGRYRNCGSTGPRHSDAVARCENAESVWYGLWRDRKHEVSSAPPQAMSTFNPQFEQLTKLLSEFLQSINADAT